MAQLCLALSYSIAKQTYLSGSCPPKFCQDRLRTWGNEELGGNSFEPFGMDLAEPD